jgi:hypothetical protein
MMARQNEIEAGFAETLGQGYKAGSVETVAATPCRMIEAWALAAHGALPCGVDPEALWGDERNPGSDHPKRLLERLMGRAPSREDFAALAEAADLLILEQRCPESFRPFADRARQIRDRCPAGHRGQHAHG